MSDATVISISKIRGTITGWVAGSKPGVTRAVPCLCQAAASLWWPWLCTAAIPVLRGDLHFAFLTQALHQLD